MEQIDEVGAGAAADAAYDAQGTVGPERFGVLMGRYRSMSQEAVDGLRGAPGLAYDEASDERLDLWGLPAEGQPPRPAVVFVHGGYWRALSRYDSAFLARTLDAHGVATVVPDYTLAPAATLEEIVRQVRAAVAWVHREGAAYGIDVGRLVVSGSSAGAHLAAMVLAEGWQREFGVPQQAVRAGMLFSGLYDLRPLVGGFTEAWLGLDIPRARALSPLLASRACAGPVVVARGEGEASGFVAQSAQFHREWAPERAALVVPERNHFDVILDLADPQTRASCTLLGLVDELG